MLLQQHNTTHSNAAPTTTTTTTLILMSDAADRIEQHSCMDNFVQYAELFAEHLQEKLKT
jgi:hypothetical protein